MNVNLYGRLADRLGRQITIEIPAEGCSVSDLRRILADCHPELQDDILRPRVRACINDRIAAETYRITPGENVEFFPPVSGG